MFALTETLRAWIVNGDFTADFVASTKRILIGLAIGVVCGVFTGCLTAVTGKVGSFISAMLQALKAIPVVALVPFAIIWLGLGEASKIALVAYGSFFSVWLSMHTGLTRIEPLLLHHAQLLGCVGWRMWIFVKFPATLASFALGFRIAAGMSVLCVVAAEMTGAQNGLGYRIMESYASFRHEIMYLSLLCLGILGLCMDWFVRSFIISLFPWAKGTLSK